MTYQVEYKDGSRSFSADDDFVKNASASGDIVVYLGQTMKTDDSKTAVLVELDTECLGVHTGENAGEEGSNVLGFCRYRNGDDAPSQLIELVRQPKSSEEAIAAAKAMFEEAGFSVSVCADQAGRIIDRLVRPKYNAALRFLDEGLADAASMDLTCKLGLGYPDGPVERVERGDLARHYDVTKAIFDMTGQVGYSPARRSVVAKARVK